MTEHDASRLAGKPANHPTNHLPPTNPLPPVTPTEPYQGESSDAAASLPTSLDTLESSVGNITITHSNKHLDAKPSLSSCFRHSGWWAQRRKILEALVRTNQSESRISNFAACGVASWIQVNNANDERFRIQTNTCHDRMCTPCANIRARRIQQCLMQKIKGGTISFITLTLSDRTPDLTALVDKLYKSFRYLRSHPLWADNVTGGAAFLEIKWNEKSSRWHPHLHIICDAKYIPQDKLSATWRSITNDSFIVHIERVRDEGKITSYVVKYATKPLNPSLMQAANILDDTIHAIRGRRLCLCFGDWYGTPLSYAEDEELADDWEDAQGWTNFEPLEFVLQRAIDQQPWALQLIAKLDAGERFLRCLKIDTG